MLLIPNIRETRLFREAYEEGADDERHRQEERHLEEKLRTAAQFAAMKIPVDKVAEVLGLDVDLVRKELAKNDG